MMASTFPIPLDAHPTLREAVEMVRATDFNEPSAPGLGRRMAFVKGLMVAVNVATVLDSNLANWATVTALMDTDFAGGGSVGDRLTATLQPAVEMAKTNMTIASGAATWPTAVAALELEDTEVCS